MLYSLLVAVLLEAAAIPVVGILCFRSGYNAAARTEKKPLLPPIRKPATKPTDEEVRLGKLLSNIENYDGTGVGQREIR
jgi:hypothetical protein